MNANAIIDSLIKPNDRPGDYIGESGLLYCGICHKPKQTYGEGFNAGRKLPIPCKCIIAEREKAEEDEKRRRIEDLRKRGLPVEAMHLHRFDVADEAKHLIIAKRYVSKWDKCSSKNIGLLFWGNTGTGKSFAAHCIANALIDREIFVCLYSASELIQCMGDRDARTETVSRLRTAPLVIVDDIGAERATEFSREQLCAAIDIRAETGKPLIVTTNYTLDEMKLSQDSAQQRIFDRLLSLCVPVAVIGESRRAKIGDLKLHEAKELLDL